MQTRKKITYSEAETLKYAAQLAAQIKSKKIILLSGSLGAGKTTFIRGFLSGLGSKDKVKSPTYTIAREYNSPKGKILHLDLYRLNSYEDVVSLGWPEMTKNYFITFVEWPERLDGNLPEKCVEIKIETINKNSRSFCWQSNFSTGLHKK
ncbi:MAG: tRNA (adenosine(37)-N6)-threonylcarbamoyltransferase complex ATPase subunit type 1 TsaE [Patescibacteria group bacterium]|nr:tRNA (adenosine(37)-N6)-threonylcarbamoyltransferase complex ATPase subunit type 1 TsaE [Patescibacteria group bacterium]